MMMRGGGPGRLGVLACMIVIVACGSESHPDSGYGENQPVPAARACDEMCERLVDCAVQLCNEDTSSRNYDILQSELTLQCKLGCSDDAVQSQLTAAEWTCMFTDSCREVFEHDSCMTGASYTCE